MREYYAEKHELDLLKLGYHVAWFSAKVIDSPALELAVPLNLSKMLGFPLEGGRQRAHAVLRLKRQDKTESSSAGSRTLQEGFQPLWPPGIALSWPGCWP